MRGLCRFARAHVVRYVNVGYERGRSHMRPPRDTYGIRDRAAERKKKTGEGVGRVEGGEMTRTGRRLSSARWER